MRHTRRVLGPIAAVWLVCQAAMLAFVPAVLGARLPECTCTYGAAGTCPMHHGTAAAGSKVCVIQSLTTSATATLSSLFISVVGLVPAPLRATAPTPTTRSVFLERSMATHRPSPPDPPPPRA